MTSYAALEVSQETTRSVLSTRMVGLADTVEKLRIEPFPMFAKRAA